ncbi:MAG: GtrA-like protein [Solirubrobacteraceae bacterium]|jgi:putative flippase GtrA|nr:GtrA-like protein [Solirubrobacteraceae bacterium]
MARKLGRGRLSGLLAAPAVRFVLVGGICFTSVILIFEALRRVLPLPVAATLAYAAGATASYELNRSWTFGRRGRSWAQAGRFVTITAAAMATNAALLQTIVASSAMPEVAAEVVSLVCIAPLTFLAYRLWGFRAEAECLRLAPAPITGNAAAGSGE